MQYPIPHSPFSDVTILDAINAAASRLAAAGITTARRDAELLLCNTLGRDRAWLLAHIRDGLGNAGSSLFEAVVGRRAEREPLQYITGKQEFWGLDFLVTPAVLIPRPETELIIESALAGTADRNAPLRIVDLGTGSGCIAVSLATELLHARFFAADLSADALVVARQNARSHEVADRVRFFEGDLLEPLEELDIKGQVDIIVSNPPYVPSGDRPGLQPEVRDYEPASALFAGPKGTLIHQRIIEGAPGFLKKSALLIMEMGIGQADSISGMIRNDGRYESFEILKDLAGIERVVVAKRI